MNTNLTKSADSSVSENHSKLMKALQIGSIVFIVGMIIAGVAIVYIKDLGYEDIVGWTPENPWLAALVLIVFYVVRTPMLIFPPWILYIAVGMVYSGSPTLAFAVSLIGSALCHAPPFYLGKFLGGDFAERFVDKHPKIKKLDRIKSENQFVFVFLIKLLQILPADVCSFVMGAWNIGFRKFFWASMIGTLPTLIVFTLFGAGLTDGTDFIKSPTFFILVAVIILMVLSSMLIFKKISKGKRSDKND